MENQLEWRTERCPISKKFDDIYFDFEKGLEESRYVFLESNRLYERFDKESKSIQIAELGFGTGLNFFATAQEFLKRNSRARLLYASCEKYPLAPEEILKTIQIWPELRSIGEEFLLHYFRKPSGFLSFELADGRIRLQIYFGDVLDYLKNLNARIDAWYFDGFSPKKNPEMWQPEIFQQVSKLSHSKTSFSSFSSAGFVRRALQEVGAHVEKQKGFGWKREMIRGEFERLPERSEGFRSENIAIVGSGIAAAQICKSLEARNIQYQVFESAEQVAPGASGNPLALSMPFLATRNKERQMFSTSAFSYQRSRYLESSYFHQSSCLQHFYPEKNESNLKQSLEVFQWPSEFLNAQDNGILIHRAGVLEAKNYLNEFWSEREDFVRLGVEILNLESFQKLHWLKDSDGETYGPFSFVVFCNAGGSLKFFPEFSKTLRRNRGQILFVKNSVMNSSAEVFDKYLSPSVHGLQVFGGTYRHDDLPPQITEDETQELEISFEDLFGRRPEFYQGRASERFFLRSSWPLLHYDSEHSVAALVGLGSRGFSESALCAETLISSYCKEMLPISAQEEEMLFSN